MKVQQLRVLYSIQCLNIYDAKIYILQHNNILEIMSKIDLEETSFTRRILGRVYAFEKHHLGKVCIFDVIYSPLLSGIPESIRLLDLIFNVQFHLSGLSAEFQLSVVSLKVLGY